MFGNKDHTAITGLIAQGTRVEGDMAFEDGLRGAGEVLGAIHGKGDGGRREAADPAGGEGRLRRAASGP
jgi:cytoskeletal protein CcmA (bactofilin family)